MFRPAVTALLVALSLSASPAIADTGPEAVIMKDTAMAQTQHQALTELLGKYVHASTDGVNRVDYTAWRADATDMARLEVYIESFAEMDLGAMMQDEACASWSNLYNAVTLRHILERYPVKSIKSGYIGGPWKKVTVNAGGRDFSLHDIEHEILRPMGDPRIHYAINCASFGCPNLRVRAWEAATLDTDLNAAAADYINHARGVSVGKRGLTVSSIYKWFEDDFGGSKTGVIEHLLEHAKSDLAAQIKASNNIRKYGYDWSLNDNEESH